MKGRTTALGLTLLGVILAYLLVYGAVVVTIVWVVVHFIRKLW